MVLNKAAQQSASQVQYGKSRTTRKRKNWPNVAILPDHLASIFLNDSHDCIDMAYRAAKATRRSRLRRAGTHQPENFPTETKLISTQRINSLSAIASSRPPCQLCTCHRLATQPSRKSLRPLARTSQNHHLSGEKGKIEARIIRPVDKALGIYRMIPLRICSLNQLSHFLLFSYRG